MNLSEQYRLAKWSFRKLRLGIGRSDIVLDVGSGGNPHPRADVLLEKHVQTVHRHGAPAVFDRPTVLADACAMPFKDKAFDFAIAFHVLEHMRDPASFLRELSRVAKAGYIEVPNVVFERFVPYDVHLLEIMDVEGKLFIQKKARQATDAFMDQLALARTSRGWNRAFYTRPELFHVRFFWKDTIPFEVVNPEENCDWFKDDEAPNLDADTVDEPVKADFRARCLGLLRKARTLSGGARVDLSQLLACPACRESVRRRGASFVCDRCEVSYPAEPLPDFNAPLRSAPPRGLALGSSDGTPPV